METKKITLYSTLDNDLREEYEEWCEEAQSEPSENGFEDYSDQIRAEEWDNMQYNIKSISDRVGKCGVTGTLGLWDGNKTIVPFVSSSIKKAFDTCIEHSYDCVISEVSVVDGSITIEAPHHDGTNVYVITALRDDFEAEDGDFVLPEDFEEYKMPIENMF